MLSSDSWRSVSPNLDCDSASHAPKKLKARDNLMVQSHLPNADNCFFAQQPVWLVSDPPQWHLLNSIVGPHIHLLKSLLLQAIQKTLMPFYIRVDTRKQPFNAVWILLMRRHWLALLPQTLKMIGMLSVRTEVLPNVQMDRYHHHNGLLQNPNRSPPAHIRIQSLSHPILTLILISQLHGSNSHFYQLTMVPALLLTLVDSYPIALWAAFQQRLACHHEIRSLWWYKLKPQTFCQQMPVCQISYCQMEAFLHLHLLGENLEKPPIKCRNSFLPWQDGLGESFDPNLHQRKMMAV